MAETASGSARRVPDVEIITGSSTTFRASQRRKPAATADAMSARASMPILQAAISRSE